MGLVGLRLWQIQCANWKAKLRGFPKDTGSSGSPSGDELENEEKGTDISKQEQANNSNDGDSGYNDDYSADIIYEISVVLDGMSSSKTHIAP